MAGKNSDVELTFDPQSFIQGLNKITQAMSKFEGNTKDTGKSVDKTSSSMSSTMVAKGMIMAQALMRMGSAVVSFIKNGVPEISKTFDIAGGIFTRNLLYPLRKELRPILQGILDWTRDHRAMFVKWGGVLVNVFRAVWQIAKGFFDMFKAIVTPIIEKIKALFGGMSGGISDVFNVLLFKITAVMMFIQVAFMPIFQKIGDIISWLIDLTVSFYRGLSDGISGIEGPFSDLINQFNELLEVLGLSTEASNTLFEVFGALGDFIGTTLYVAVSVLAGLLDGIVFGITKIVQGITWAKAKISGTKEDVAKINAEMAQTNKDFANRQIDRGKGIANKVGGAVDRTSARFSPSSATASKTINANSKINIEKMTIEVPKGEDTKKAGADFIEGMNKKNSQQVKNILLNEQGAMGF